MDVPGVPKTTCAVWLYRKNIKAKNILKYVLLYFVVYLQYFRNNTKRDIDICLNSPIELSNLIRFLYRFLCHQKALVQIFFQYFTQQKHFYYYVKGTLSSRINYLSKWIIKFVDIAYAFEQKPRDVENILW